MNRLTRLAAVVLPVIGLAGVWGMSDHTYRQGTEWEVPIQGYDPRDFLRGHYVEFGYDWPGFFNEGIVPEALCLTGKAPRLDRAERLTEGEPCAHPVRADLSGVYSWDALMRGRLYVGQDRALALEEELRNRDQRGIVTIRQREDGSFTPIAIRFRPLTPAEQAERDAQDQPPTMPPAIMDAP
ncbi:MAG: GDYXXLXY domain-containing protein [Erythrobacter sp.]|nr:GDYXXLXY domain-containing protein [Erythrobacter sp.]MDZ4274350.1 GDYXXLXY domain-containing protein [Erythrobacter sp.]MDZ4274905.1 GDYXXLXY domain-containing protein [Erythrobacter sp.]